MVDPFDFGRPQFSAVIFVPPPDAADAQVTGVRRAEKMDDLHGEGRGERRQRDTLQKQYTFHQTERSEKAGVVQAKAKAAREKAVARQESKSALRRGSKHIQEDSIRSGVVAKEMAAKARCDHTRPCFHVGRQNSGFTSCASPHAHPNHRHRHLRPPGGRSGRIRRSILADGSCPGTLSRSLRSSTLPWSLRGKSASSFSPTLRMAFSGSIGACAAERQATATIAPSQHHTVTAAAAAAAAASATATTITSHPPSCVDILFICDLFLAMVRPYENAEGESVTYIPAIICNYMKWWFFVDAIACVPYDLIDYTMSNSSGSAAVEGGGVTRRLVRGGIVPGGGPLYIPLPSHLVQPLVQPTIAQMNHGLALDTFIYLSIYLPAFQVRLLRLLKLFRLGRVGRIIGK